jgi:quinol monooxygenase YgiN
MATYLTARFRVLPEWRDETLEVIRTFVDAVDRKELGTRLYLSLQSEASPDEFLHLFVFEDDAAEEVHRTSAAVRAFTDRLYPHLQEDVEFKTFRRVAGTSVKGSL